VLLCRGGLSLPVADVIHDIKMDSDVYRQPSVLGDIRKKLDDPKSSAWHLRKIFESVQQHAFRVVQSTYFLPFMQKRVAKRRRRVLVGRRTLRLHTLP